MDDHDLLRRLQRAPQGKSSYKTMVAELGLGGGHQRRLLRETLARLTLAGTLVRVDNDHWQLTSARTTGRQSAGLVTGKLDLHRDGYGFVRPAGAATRDEDVFIPPPMLGGAMQGDQVQVELDRPNADGRRSGRIVRVAERRAATVVGIFHYGSPRKQKRRRAPQRHALDRPVIPTGFHYVTPLDERMTQPVLIADGDELPSEVGPATQTANRTLGEEALAQQVHAAWDSDADLEGLAVNVELTQFPTPHSLARGRVVEVLGEEDAFGVDVEIVIRKHHLPHVFPESVLAEARAAAAEAVLLGGRRDFRGLPIVTIDGETAKDFDDAVLVTDLPNGNVQLQVHIADVAHYVLAGSALDREARLRGNSVYFPDRAVPMLPQELSSDACSLRPHEDRYVLSCVMEFDAAGVPVAYEICEGVIRSAARMTYTAVAAILDGDPALRDEYHALAPAFDRMLAFAKVLNAQRVARGSIDFDLPEAVIEFDELGAMRGIVRAERHWSNRIIEEFMLAANECVATYLEAHSIPALYRIHEQPDAAKVLAFEEAAAAFGYSLGAGNLPVQSFQMKGDRREQQRRDGRRNEQFRQGGRNGRGQGGHLGRGGRTASQPKPHEIAGEINVSPKMYQKLAAQIAGKWEERILSMLMLRSLKQARYAEQNEGHFALATDNYTHFTSPIRRYPDLIVHRVLKAQLAAGMTLADSVTRNAQKKSSSRRNATTAEQISPAELADIARETSEAERRAADAERELIEWKKIRFMEDRVGEEFDAMVLSVTKYGLFVELNEMFLEGLVPIQTMSDLGERFHFRENAREISGEDTGRAYRVGERVRVLLDRILRMERRLQFALVDTNPAPRNKRKFRR